MIDSCVCVVVGSGTAISTAHILAPNDGKIQDGSTLTQDILASLFYSWRKFNV